MVSSVFGTSPIVICEHFIIYAFFFFMLKKFIFVFVIIIVGMKGPDKDIGSWAASEDVKEPENKQVLVKASRLLDRGRGLVIINR